MNNIIQAAQHLRDIQKPTTAKQAPEENGIRLATILRSDGDELRVNWSEFKGRNFVNLRIWSQGDNEQWWPQKDKGLTVRLSELSDFAEGIGKALELATQAPDESPRPNNPVGTPQRGQGRSTSLKNGHDSNFDDDVSDVGRG